MNNGLSVQWVSENVHFAENHYNFRYQSGTKFNVDHVKTEIYGKLSIPYIGPNDHQIRYNTSSKHKKTKAI